MNDLKILRIVCAVCVVAAMSVDRSVAQGTSVPWSSFDMGSGVSASGNASVKSAAGQLFAGTSQQAGTRVESGFLAHPLFRGLGNLTFQVQGGWNMVAVPSRVPDPRKIVLFPEAVSNAFRFDNGYVASESLGIGRGYWMKFSQPRPVTIFGLPAVAETIAVVQGWNLMGGISLPVDAVAVGSIPPGLVVSNFFQFKIPDGYLSSPTLEPGKAYWVKADRAGSLIVSAGTSMTGRVVIRPTADLPPPPPADGVAGGLPLPTEYGLGQAYPNPFNPETRIEYMLPQAGRVELRVFNVLGELVATLVDQEQEAGVLSVRWNAAAQPSGIYFYCLRAGSFTDTRKMILLR